MFKSYIQQSILDNFNKNNKIIKKFRKQWNKLAVNISFHLIDTKERNI